MTTTMKLILRPCTVYATNLIHHSKKITFSCSVSNPRNVSSRPSIQRVSKRQQITVTKDNIFRCYSSVGDSTHHHISDAGSIDSTLMLSMQNKIRDQLNAESVVVQDAYGDGRHVSIDVVSSAFEGQSAVNRQRMVYKAIWEELQTTVHAVDQMTTKTPTEAGVEN